MGENKMKKKIDPTVLKETGYIAAWVLVFSALTQAVFLMIGKWDITVLLGNLLSGGASVLNFFLMGLTVQSAVLKEQKEAKTAMRVSQIYRTLMMLVIVIIGVVAPCFNVWTVFIPIFFPRVAIMLRPIFDKRKK